MEPGRTVGNWLIVGVLGRGQSGQVYKVRKTIGERRPAALKIHRGRHLKVSAEEFRREAALVNELSRRSPRFPGPGFLDGGEWDGVPFYVMERMKALPDRLVQGDLVRVGVGIIDAVARLHETGYFHCDLKPCNIGRLDGEVHLLDFGSACPIGEAACGGIRVGTDHYMAPEVRAGGRVSVQSEIHSIGITLAELCREEDRHVFASFFAHATDPDSRSRTQSLAELRQELLDAAPRFRRLAARATRLPRFWAVATVAGICLVLVALAVGGIALLDHWLCRRDVYQRNEQQMTVEECIRAGVACYQACDFVGAYTNLATGMSSELYNPDDFKGVNVKGLRDDSLRRQRETESAWPPFPSR